MQSFFNITTINTDYSNKQIIIKTTFSIDSKSVNRKNVQIASALSGTTVVYKLSVDDDKIIVTLKDWPELDSNYIVKIANIKDMLGRELNHSLTKEVTFKTDTKIKVIITSPNNNEAVVKEHKIINFSIKQINPDGSETTNKKPDSDPTLPKSGDKEAMTEDELNVMYHFEFASDIAFFDIVNEYKSPYTEGSVLLDNGQYYMRARAIENNITGDWSEVVTFTVVPELCSSELDDAVSQQNKDYIEEIMSPIEFFLGDEVKFEIASRSNNGTTHEEFFIEFSEDIDPDTLIDTIMAYRRDL